MARRSGLGKGLDSLIPTGGEGEGSLRDIPLSQITANRYQPRVQFDEESLASLTASVRELGVLQPILVRPVGDGEYELIAGERRFRAAKRAGLTTVPALVRTVEDLSSLEQALVENLHRQDLNPLEEAAAYQQLIEDFELTQEQVAKRCGRSRSAVANLLRLFQLPPEVQKLVAEGELTAGHARTLLGTPDEAYQVTLARRIVEDQLSVRDVEEAVRLRNEGPAPTPQRGSSPAEKPAAYLEVEDLLAGRLETRVKVDGSGGKGRLVVQFADVDDLDRITRILLGEPPRQTG
jgi:ParB family transcriptional regulator, chromosome partitioning protein